MTMAQRRKQASSRWGSVPELARPKRCWGIWVEQKGQLLAEADTKDQNLGQTRRRNRVNYHPPRLDCSSRFWYAQWWAELHSPIIHGCCCDFEHSVIYSICVSYIVVYVQKCFRATPKLSQRFCDQTFCVALAELISRQRKRTVRRVMGQVAAPRSLLACSTGRRTWAPASSPQDISVLHCATPRPP